LLAFVLKTYYYQRIIRNPSYYGLASAGKEFVSEFVSELIDNAVTELARLGAMQEDDDIRITPLPIGEIAHSHCILPSTSGFLAATITAETGHRSLLRIVASSAEFKEFPIREGKLVRHLSSQFSDLVNGLDDNAQFTTCLFRAHLSRILPPEFLATFSAMCVPFARILRAAIDVSAARGWLTPTVAAIQLTQRIVQAVLFDDSELLQLPHFDRALVDRCTTAGINTVQDLRDAEDCQQLLGVAEDDGKWIDICDAVNRMPSCSVEAALRDGAVVVAVARDIEEDEVVGPVFAPRFPLPKSEIWFALLAIGDRELAAVEKAEFTRQCEFAFACRAPPAAPLRVFLICDTYIGCDRACDVADLRAAE
jgi:pre-mRNA-splicing helicase BRR2